MKVERKSWAPWASEVFEKRAERKRFELRRKSLPPPELRRVVSFFPLYRI